MELRSVLIIPVEHSHVNGGILLQVLGVRQGYLDLHGRPRHVTWTRLAETAVANATILTLQQQVDWVPGDRIVVAPTGKNGNETEVREIWK